MALPRSESAGGQTRTVAPEDDMALVICSVLFTLRIRRRMSISAGIGYSRPRSGSYEASEGWKTPANSERAALSFSVSSPLMSFFSPMSFMSEASRADRNTESSSS
jgi:hypothetical protein